MSTRKYRIGIDGKMVGEKIAQIRGFRSQVAFAKLLNITQPALSRYENGQIPSPKMLVRIAQHDSLQRGIGWLLTRDVEDLTQPLAKDPIEIYGRLLAPEDRNVVKDVAELLHDTKDQDIRNKLKDYLAFLRHAKKTPKGRASGED